jgi:hypothetical protein
VTKKKAEDVVPQALRNRIVGSGTESSEKLPANPKIWRRGLGRPDS